MALHKQAKMIQTRHNKNIKALKLKVILMFTNHYKPRKISELKKTDEKVAIVGKVVESKDGSFVLGDGMEKAEIFFEGHVEQGKMLRVFCSLIDERLTVDVVQSLNGLDTKLFNKVQELYRKVGV